MGDVNLEIKLSNLDERVIKIEESGGGSGGDSYITSVSNDFNVVNKKLSLSNDVTTKLSKVDDKIDKPSSATDGQVLTYNGTSNEWEAKKPSASITEPTDLEKGIIGGDEYNSTTTYAFDDNTKPNSCIKNNKIYTVKSNVTSFSNIEPTVTSGWEEYWEETSISALNSKLKLFPDFAKKLTLTDGTWTASEDCWYNYLCMDSKEPYSLKIDNVVVSTSDKAGGVYTSYACGFAKKGSVFTNEYLSLLCKAYPLK